MDKLYEQDYETCKYCEVTYEEWDTGYKEYDCTITGGQCVGYENGCPLSFTWEIIKNNK